MNASAMPAKNLTRRPAAEAEVRLNAASSWMKAFAVPRLPEANVSERKAKHTLPKTPRALSGIGWRLRARCWKLKLRPRRLLAELPEAGTACAWARAFAPARAEPAPADLPARTSPWSGKRRPANHDRKCGPCWI